MEEKPPAYDNLNVVEDPVGYRVPEECARLTGAQKGVGSMRAH